MSLAGAERNSLRTPACSDALEGTICQCKNNVVPCAAGREGLCCRGGARCQRRAAARVCSAAGAAIGRPISCVKPYICLAPLQQRVQRSAGASCLQTCSEQDQHDHTEPLHWGAGGLSDEESTRAQVRLDAHEARLAEQQREHAAAMTALVAVQAQLAALGVTAALPAPGVSIARAPAPLPANPPCYASYTSSWHRYTSCVHKASTTSMIRTSSVHRSTSSHTNNQRAGMECVRRRYSAASSQACG